MMFDPRRKPFWGEEDRKRSLAQRRRDLEAPKATRRPPEAAAPRPLRTAS
jgi:hypothetical protein